MLPPQDPNKKLFAASGWKLDPIGIAPLQKPRDAGQKESLRDWIKKTRDQRNQNPHQMTQQSVNPKITEGRRISDQLTERSPLPEPDETAWVSVRTMLEDKLITGPFKMSESWKIHLLRMADQQYQT